MSAGSDTRRAKLTPSDGCAASVCVRECVPCRKRQRLGKICYPLMCNAIEQAPASHSECDAEEQELLLAVCSKGVCDHTTTHYTHSHTHTCIQRQLWNSEMQLENRCGQAKCSCCWWKYMHMSHNRDHTATVVVCWARTLHFIKCAPMFIKMHEILLKTMQRSAEHFVAVMFMRQLLRQQHQHQQQQQQQHYLMTATTTTHLKVIDSAPH